MNFRLFFLIFIFTLLYGGLGFRLYELQITKNQDFIDKVHAREEIAAQLELRRGSIYFTDRNGTQIPVALNHDRQVIFISPKETEKPVYAAELLALPTGIAKDVIFKKILGKPRSSFEMLLEKPSEEQIKAISQLKIKGVKIQNKQYRFYQYDELASQLIGFVGVNDKNDKPRGLYGTEKFYDNSLSEGGNLELTIDRNIQKQSEQVLGKLVQTFSAVRGTVIVEEPATGKILALANTPGFNPNEYGKSPVEDFINFAAQSVYEPGSVFKPFTMAAGIETGVFTPETSFVDTGSVILNGKKIQNWDLKAHGRITMTNVIEQSVNTGAVYAEKLIGNDNFLKYVKKFGFGKKTGIDLSDEVNGSLKNLENKKARAVDYATASFGQGQSVTAIQLVNAFSTLANGGLLMRPYLNADLKPEVLRRVVSEETAKKVTAMMESAVEKAHVAAITDYRVAGKTGTAQIPNFQSGGYTDEFFHTFVGFAPVSQPKFVLLIRLEKPKAALAGATVVTAFRELAGFILNYYNLPPDKVPAE